MQRLTVTPFGRRPVTAGLIATRTLASAPAPHDAVDKWQVFRDLTTARAALGIPSRALTVLSALLSFHPVTALSGADPIIVFPSNRSLAERAHGMAEATLRRHLAALGAAGLILRHDSPNGKRYAARDASGAPAVAFGFDLRPLLLRAAEIAAAARASREAAVALRRKREALVLRIRDAEKLAAFAAFAGIDDAGVNATVTDLKRALRRKLDGTTLDHFLACADAVARTVEDRAAAAQAAGTSGGDAQNERHNQDSDSEIPCSESGDEAEAEAAVPQHPEPVDPATAIEAEDARGRGTLSLTTLLAACPSLTQYAAAPLDGWPDLIRSADRIRPWLGITAETWRHAIAAMGPLAAAICLACLLERGAEIRSPGAYLRSLSLRAANGRFDPEPMVVGLLARRDAKLTAVNS